MDFSADDGGNADAFVLLHGDEFLYVPAFGWLHWNGRCWERDDAAMTSAIEDTLIQRGQEAIRCKQDRVVDVSKRNAYRIQGMQHILQSRLIATTDDFDSDPDLLNADNGVINLRTGELIPHVPSQRFTYALAVDYDPTADGSEWEAFIKDAVTPRGEQVDTTLIDFLQQAIGYSLTGRTQEERLFYVYGPTRSGKGTFSESLLELIPRPVSMEVDFNTFTAKRDASDQNFDLADMKPSRLVFASESNKYQSLNPGKIKQLTGGNWISAAFKHKDRFSYRPQYTVWLSSNHPVMGDPEDDALWYRVLVVTFPNSHAGSEDTTLKARLKSPEVQRGILKWAVEGAIKWYTSGRLQIPERVNLATKEHRDVLDNIAVWLSEETLEVSGGFTPSSALYQSYEKWCKGNGVEPKKQRELGLSLTKRGYRSGKKYVEEKKDLLDANAPDSGPFQVRGYFGIGLLDP